MSFSDALIQAAAAARRAENAIAENDGKITTLMIEGIKRFTSLENHAQDTDAKFAMVGTKIAEIDEKLTQNFCDDEAETVISKTREIVFLVQGETYGSGVLLKKGLILTVAHLGFQFNSDYIIKGTQNRTYKVTCTFISIQADVAALQINNYENYEEIMKHDNYKPGTLSPGRTHYCLGYPIIENEAAVLKTCVEGFHNDKKHVLAVPGARKGFSGAPVFTRDCSIAGIIVKSYHDAKGDAAWNAVEQSAVVILPIACVEWFFELFDNDKLKSDSSSRLMIQKQ